MLTLGIETSCDETSASVVYAGESIRSNIILSQADHSKFGGVVPELASRAHVRNIIPIYKQALEEAQCQLEDIELISATMGPGLVGALLVGLSFAKGLAFATGKPFVPVHHIEGHLSANLLSHPELHPHHLTLIVSGGHTMLVEVKAFGEYRTIGQTKDDAAGEAFDKIAKLLGLGYPGGAQIDKLAKQGDPNFYKFPRPIIKDQSYQFSFSGLKTAVVLYVDKITEKEKSDSLPHICASFQEAVVDVLASKTVRAADELGVSHITLSGGVAANSRLRTVLSDRLKAKGKKLFYPEMSLCTDNAAMIASAGYYRYKKEGPGNLIANAFPYLPLEQIESEEKDT